MIAAAVIVLFVASATAAPVEPWWGNPKAEYSCGGTQQGQYYSYQNDYNIWGRVTKIEVWAGDFVDAIRMTHGDAPEGPKIGGIGGVQQGNVNLAQNEVINGINVEKQAIAGGEAICRITFNTNFGRYGPYGACRHDGVCGERTFPSPMLYLSVSYAANIIGFVFTY